MIALLLEHWNLLKAPLLYLSLFFKRHRDEYYRRLNLVRLEGDWEGWTDFYLDGVATIADEAVASARDLFNLVATDRARLLGLETASVSALRLLEQLPRHPIVTVASAVRLLDASKPTATRAIEVLAGVGILVETTGKRRDRSFAYRAYMECLSAGTELGPDQHQDLRRRPQAAGSRACDDVLSRPGR
jgi:Fic family protein